MYKRQHLDIAGTAWRSGKAKGATGRPVALLLSLIHIYNIDGIILSEKYHTIRTVKFLRSATIPVVELMDVQGERLDMEVGFDNRQAAFDMVCTCLLYTSRCV